MEMLEGILNRTSSPLLEEPAPSPEQIEYMLQAAIRAPDHGRLKPYRFILIEGQEREVLGELFLSRLLEINPDADEKTCLKTRNMPLRAPMLLVLVACPRPHPKVPASEQVHTTACAGQNILHGAYAQGLGGVWRTGWVAEDKQIQKQLGLTDEEQMLGYIYLGTPKNPARKTPEVDSADYISFWKSDH